MPTNVKRYQLLISCPGDVKDEVQIIKDAVSKFNSTFTDTLDIMIQTRDWSKDSYPATGGKAQEILNKQIVDKCDAAVAIFWTRFGTPTDEYYSGSEEEIERMIASEKNVFLYFSNVPVPLSSIDSEQYQKVKEYKAKFEKGLYREYSSLDEFRELFYNHISKYFSELSDDGEITDEKKPEIDVELIDDEKGDAPESSYKYKSACGLITYRKLSKDDIFEEIADRVTIENINAYNEALPPEEEVRAYNKELKLYEDAQNNCYEFKLSISNIGTTMAHEIYVDLEFPEGILVYKENAVEDIDEPCERPEMPENPVWKAIEENNKKKYKSLYRSIEAISHTEKLAKKMAGINDFGFSGLNTSYASIPVSSYRVKFPTTVDYTIADNRILTVHIDDLLHTRQYNSDKFSLIFTSYGEFEIKYSVMCEEWEEPIKGSFAIKVEY